ncbi:MAG: thiamine phosphate synthase, partial [Acidaminococcaceae bacterium]
IDYSIYLVTDHECLGSRNFLTSIELALRGGATLVQLREKNTEGKLFWERAVAIKKLCDRYQVPLIINDRVDIALALGAAGVHLGQGDLPVAIARKLLGAQAIIGVSAHNVSEALLAREQGADYLGVGAVFPTTSKANTTDVGLERLVAIRQVTTLPLVGIGGITLSNYAQVLATGANGAAIISGILWTEAIEQTVQKLQQLLATKRA